MTKKILSSLVILFLISFAISSNSVKSLENKTLISPAIEIIQTETFLAKGNVYGSAVNFSEKDFSKLYASSDWKHVEILSLPESTVGVLEIEGKAVKEGEEISMEKADKLKFIPSGQDIGKTEFNFCFDSSHSKYKCIITMGENEQTAPKSQNLASRTYRNVAVFSEIEIEDGHYIEITEPCKNGIISIDKKSGKFTYHPSTNFVGSDEFEYCVYDEYGNASENSTIKIKTEKAKNNLYFHDLADKPEHKTAVYVCSEGLLPYATDENDLPIFGSDEIVERQTFLSAVKKMLPNAVISEQPYEYIGEAEAIHILSIAIASEFGKEAEVMEVIEPTATSGTILTKRRCAIFLEEVAQHLATSYFADP